MSLSPTQVFSKAVSTLMIVSMILGPLARTSSAAPLYANNVDQFTKKLIDLGISTQPAQLIRKATGDRIISQMVVWGEKNQGALELTYLLDKNSENILSVGYIARVYTLGMAKKNGLDSKSNAGVPRSSEISDDMNLLESTSQSMVMGDADAIAKITGNTNSPEALELAARLKSVQMDFFNRVAEKLTLAKGDLPTAAARVFERVYKFAIGGAILGFVGASFNSLDNVRTGRRFPVAKATLTIALIAAAWGATIGYSNAKHMHPDMDFDQIRTTIETIRKNLDQKAMNSTPKSQP